MSVLGNISRKISALAVGLAVSIGISAPAYTFSGESPLSSGKWVKVEVQGDGLYTITYDALREMGFDDPTKVSVYGRGGKLFSMSFTGSDNGVAYTDGLPEIGVIHSGNRLTFYAVGTDNVAFKPAALSGVSGFVRNPKNIYSDSSWYFLTDKNESAAEMDKSQVSGAVTEITEGLWYAYHEEDLAQNATGTGQLFWGESLMEDGASRRWEMPTPMRIAGDGYIETAWYLSPSAQATVTYSPGGTEKPVINLSTTSSKMYVPKNDRRLYTFGEGETLNVGMDVELMNAKFMHLDYWTFTYRKRVPATLADVANVAADYVVNTNTSGMVGLKRVPGLELLDVTDPLNPVRGESVVSDEDELTAIYTDGTPRHIVAFNPDVAYNEIKSWHRIDNRNLRGLTEVKPDMIVVSVPKFKEYALQIADAHQSKDGQKVVVVSPEEIYDEFSGGVPDAMAYRALVKYVYENGGGNLKNLLLFGPSDKNLRQKVAGESCWDRIIAFHEPDATGDRDASVVYDFYGILSDIVTPSLLNRERMTVGVGILPCETAEECRRMVIKIEEYLDDESWAWRTNTSLVTGGTGDNHTHELQAVEFGKYISGTMPVKSANTTLCIDAYGYARAKQEFKRHLNDGMGLNVYFGHGSSRMIGKTLDFFHVGDALGMQNSRLGFMFMGGCDFSLPDQRKRGLGEAMVIGADRCMIASVISTRTTWSNQNYDFGQRMVKALYTVGNPDSTPTIGEAYASAKSGSDYANSTCYVLVGDPSLRLPLARRKIEPGWQLEDYGIAPGEKMTVSGQILGSNQMVDEGYNGTVVLRFMQPSVTLRSADYVTGAATNETKLDVEYSTVPEFSAELPVKNGKFEGEIMIPESVGRFVGEVMPLYIGGYDPQRHLGAAGYMDVAVKVSTGTGNANKDLTAPDLEAGYDAGARALVIRAVDDLALDATTGGVRVKIAGETVEVVASERGEANEQVREFSGYVDLSGFAAGDYSAEVESRDVAGNMVTTSFEFTVSEEAAPLHIELDHKAVVDELTATVKTPEGEEYSQGVEFEITDSDGNSVYKGVLTGCDLSWNLCDAQGVRKESGLYRIMVRGVGSEGASKYSQWTYFAILD